MPFYSYPQPIRADDVLEKHVKHHRKNINRAAYTAMIVSLLLYGVLALTEVFMEDEKCDRTYKNAQQNVDYGFTPCDFDRQMWLMGMSRMDAMMARRMMFSSIMGAIIGWERRAVDRPAGMRTMSLVCMGACLFTLSSVFAFLDGPMNWDASRVSAAIPSGVGFLGAGLIWKTTTGEGQESVHQIHGLTTAASIWLAASIGVAVGGGYYFISLYSVILIVKVLKYGPRIFYQKDDTARYDSSSDDSDSEHRDDSSHASQSAAVISDLEYGLGGGRGALRGGERDALLQDWNHRVQCDSRFPPFSGYQYNSLPPERSMSFPPQSRGEGVMGFRERGTGAGGSGVQMTSRESAASLVSELSNSAHVKSPVRRHMTDKALTADQPASLLSS